MVGKLTKGPLARGMLAGGLLAAALLAGTLAGPVSAEVRFGNNVRVGGHDASNQTFNKKRRGRYNIYKGKPPNPGCHNRKNSDGSVTKVCNLQRKKPKKK